MATNTPNMATRKINVFLSSFYGLGLPSSLNLVFPVDAPLDDLKDCISHILPPLDTRLIITTNSNKKLIFSEAPLSSYLQSDHDTFLQLRLSAPLLGGKGGFGSQLRAAGGRMSSKRKKDRGENNSSNRNLDGRRLRTVNEAKALAEYLALKPDMEKKEKETRRKRWEQVIELAERREEEVRSGSTGKVDGKWVEDKEEATERTRDAVLAAMESGNYYDNLKSSLTGNLAQVANQTTQSMEEDGRVTPGPSSLILISKPVITPVRSYAGFDEDVEFLSESDDEDVGLEDEAMGDSKGKGKA
ncbi:MAG: hypothetical protein Q9163_003118 [Psora crenata]